MPADHLASADVAPVSRALAWPALWRVRSRALTWSRFEGTITGVGTASGLRAVIGWWDVSPWGPFADVMVELADGHRLLLAPDQTVAAFVTATYTFDEVVQTPVTVLDTDAGWRVEAGPLRLDLTIGARTLLGRLLGLMPEPVATAPWFASLVDPVARVLLRGVRTKGSGGAGRQEWYAATDVHRVDAVTGTWRGEPVGALRAVEPAVRFGFSSTPRSPAMTSVVTTVRH